MSKTTSPALSWPAAQLVVEVTIVGPASRDRRQHRSLVKRSARSILMALPKSEGNVCSAFAMHSYTKKAIPKKLAERAGFEPTHGNSWSPLNPASS
jgi:hypothetical protein